MKILITGVAGFVGSTIARELINNGHKISSVDNFSYGYPERIKDIQNKINFYDKGFYECLNYAKDIIK